MTVDGIWRAFLLTMNDGLWGPIIVNGYDEKAKPCITSTKIFNFIFKPLLVNSLFVFEGWQWYFGPK